MQKRRPSGFTILELLVTVAIVAILLSIGVPSFGQAMRRNRVATVTNDVSAAFALAKSEAVKRGMLISVCGSNAAQSNCANSTNWSNGMIVFHDETGVTGALDGTDQLIQAVAPAVSKQVTLTNDRNFLSFRPNGSADMLAMDQDEVTVVPAANCSGTEAREIRVNRAGRPSVIPLACP